MSTDEIAQTLPDDSAPVRICRKCSTQSQTAGDFCPHCGARYTQRKRSKKIRALLFGIPSFIVLAAAIVAVALVVHHHNQVIAKKHAALVAARARAERAAKAKAAAQAAAQAKRAEAEAAKLVANTERASLVSSLEAAVKKTAKKDVAAGALNGPIIKVQCEPATSLDATAKIATYTCLAATSQSGTTLNGYDFTGTINLNSGDITWRLGSSI